MSNQNDILALFPIFLEIKKNQQSFKPGHSLLFQLVEHILSFPTKENAQYRKRWTKWKSHGLKPDQPLTTVQRLMSLQKSNTLGAYMDIILLCPNIQNWLDISFKNIPYPAILVYKKLQDPAPVPPGISAPIVPTPVPPGISAPIVPTPVRPGISALIVNNPEYGTMIPK